MNLERGEKIMGYMFFVWIMIMIIAVIIEISTTDLTSFWFAIGAIGALISNLFLHNDLIPVQVSIFALISIICIFTLRPLIKKRMNSPKIATNADALIGQKVIVLSKIELNHSGIVKADGIEWTAITKSDEFEPGDFVKIVQIEGNTLLVEKTNERNVENL